MNAAQPGQLLHVGFEGTELPADLAALISAGRIGGVTLFSRNLRGPEQTRGLVADLHAAAPDDCLLTVSIDQEGGRVQRLRAPWTEWPPMARLGERGSLEDTRAVATAIGRELADLGFDLDFAPVVDVHSNPDNPVIGDRSFGTDPERVGEHAGVFVEALQAAGVGACAKHFPGHGDTGTDSHLTLPVLPHDWGRLRDVELPPFRAAVEAGVASVMTAHILLPELDRERPATFCRAAVDWLRGELGFDGLVFSDDLEMAAVYDHWTPAQMVELSMEAGIDALLVCSRSDLRDQVLSELEQLPDTALEQALARTRALKERHSGGRAVSAAGPPYPDHQALARRIA